MDPKIIGTIASIITVIYTAFGLPVQIRKILRQHSTTGLSLFMTIMLLATFSSWVVYALVIKDWFILVSNAPGAICAVFILFLFYRFRHHSELTTSQPS